MRARILRIGSTSVLTVLLTVGHSFYSWWCSMRLYEWSGGIRKLPSGWTEFGGAAYAWTIPLELPGAAILRWCEFHGNSECAGTLPAQIGWVLMLLPSLVTAYLISNVLIALVMRGQISWGRWYWRAVLIALGLVWIPVREDFAPVFQYTVIY